MEPAWQVLESAGVPCGPASSTKPELSDLVAVVRATRDVLARVGSLDERQRVSLLAWLRAWASAFPTSFREAFGDEGDQVLARAAEGVEDAGRYLKLRRIAREKLLFVL
jgi:hypothetical protein